MKTKTLVLALQLAAVLFTAPVVHGGEDDIAAGDAIYAGRTVSTGAVEALARYEAAFNGSRDYEAKWKAARAQHWIGDKGGTKRDRNAAFEKGIELAKAAIAAAPHHPEAHFWLAALYGSYGELRGVLKSLGLVGPIRAQLEEVNRIDERYQGGGGYRVLGVVDYKVPGIAGGSRKRAKERLEKALAIDPANPFNQFYMAEFLAETGKKDEAAKFLDQLAASGPTPDVDGPDLKALQAKGEALRKRIKR